MEPRFRLVPLEGVLPVHLEMDRHRVSAEVGEPDRTTVSRQSGLPVEYRFRNTLSVRYCKDGKVKQIGVVPGCNELYLGDKLLWSQRHTLDPNQPLLLADPSPIEVNGFLVFPRLRVTTTGFHDGDRSQRALTVFRPGLWDEAIQMSGRKPNLARYV